MAFYKACPINMQRDTGFYPESSSFMFSSRVMQSAFTEISFTFCTTLSLELSIISSLIIAGLSILSIVSLLLVIILA